MILFLFGIPNSLQNLFTSLYICFQACEKIILDHLIENYCFLQTPKFSTPFFYKFPPIIEGVNSGLFFVAYELNESLILDSMHCEDLVNLFLQY